MTCSIRQVPHQLLLATQISLLMVSIPSQTFGKIGILCPSVHCLIWPMIEITISAQSNSGNTKYFTEIGVTVWFRHTIEKWNRNTKTSLFSVNITPFHTPHSITLQHRRLGMHQHSIERWGGQTLKRKISDHYINSLLFTRQECISLCGLSNRYC